MWKANGGKRTQRPVHWLDQIATVNLLKELKKGTKVILNDFDLVKTVRGGKMPGTWGQRKVAIAYAEYLSPKFHAWVLESGTLLHRLDDDEKGSYSVRTPGGP